MDFCESLPVAVSSRIALYAEEAEKIRKNAPAWGKLKTYPLDKPRTARAAAADIQAGKYSSFRPVGAFEASTRTQDEGVVLYVRYVGE